MVTKPCSLSSLARKAIWDSLPKNTPLIKTTKNLPFPEVIKEYLCAQPETNLVKEFVQQKRNNVKIPMLFGGPQISVLNTPNFEECRAVDNFRKNNIVSSDSESDDDSDLGVSDIYIDPSESDTETETDTETDTETSTDTETNDNE